MFTPGEVYPSSRINTPSTSSDDEAVTVHKQKDLPRASKGRVLVIDLADLLCGPAGNGSGLRRIGDKWVGKCPLPGCASKLRSFAVWPTTDSWHCFCCLRGGSVTDLARHAGYELVARARGWRSL
jgi:hypothetical protein